ncbi:hypothetical protein WN51_14488 [Melipona quadrifasciata]|uniref:Uncharacterized protein n=1 Tax=Melipona quadrifasciata TaxID=166423 RepID=A0A0N0BFJ3_9HYME|nr:hypothetical protein WN51_14488 [Melipona quadrifasciata]
MGDARRVAQRQALNSRVSKPSLPANEAKSNGTREPLGSSVVRVLSWVHAVQRVISFRQLLD